MAKAKSRQSRNGNQTLNPSVLLKKDYDLGRQIRDQLPEQGQKRYRKESFKNVAKATRIPIDAARRLAQLVDTESGYTPEEFENLCRLCDEHKYKLGRTLLMALLSVPRGKKRDKLQVEMITKGWKKTQLRRRLLTDFGRRCRGGRRPTIPRGTKERLWELDRLCNRLVRWSSVVRGSDNELGTVQTQRKRSKLPANVFAKFIDTVKMVEALREALGKHIENRD